MTQPAAVKVLFGSCTTDHLSRVLAEFQKIRPELPLVVVSEFPPNEGEWIPFNFRRSLRENIELCRARLAGRRIQLATIALESARPYRRLRLMGLRMAPLRTVVFTEHLSHFSLHPRDTSVILRHFASRLRQAVHAQTHPGGWVHTWLWRFGHPSALRRPVYYRTAQLGGAVTRWLKRHAPKREIVLPAEPLPAGISVVIPSRNGRDLLAQCLPPLLEQLESGEVIVVDNGSDDGTPEFLASFPRVIVEHSPSPLSFACAVNRGIGRAQFARVCLLNNDMVVEPGFIFALDAAFQRVPHLFCATAQIFMPEGQRREETGKAVMPPKRSPTEFPVTCVEPVEGEDDTYVLYGSGGASLYDTRKLRALGCFAEAFDPAYVEDLDVGFNAWRLGWPTVFISGARVLHQHRATTSRYFTETQLRLVLERNYLRFLARSVTDPRLFASLWQEAIWRITVDGIQHPENAEVLRQGSLAPSWMEPQCRAAIPETEVLAIGSGAISVFRGRPDSGRPRVLVVSPYVPFPLSHGGAVRMYNLMLRAARDFEQVLVCFVDELHPAPPELLEICSEIVYVQRFRTHALPSTERPDMVEEFDSPVFRAALHQTVRKWSPAIAQLEFTHMAQYAADCRPARTILVEHDITFDLYAQLLKQRRDYETRRQHERWVRFEQDAWGTVDRVVTMSEKDRRAVGRPHAVALPNGVDLQRFQPCCGSPDPCRILFIGSFVHLPNLLALDFFLREAWPALRSLGAVLHIIAGPRPEYYLDLYKPRVQPDLDQGNIEVEAFVSDVRPAYRRATVVIAPLLASAGTNIKIMEAMAMGKAVVSTPAGINGLNDLENGRDVVVTPTGAGMADAITELIRNPARRREIELQARETVIRRYDWDVIADQQKAFYNTLLGTGVDS